MSSKTGKNGFAVGREVGGCGRFTRLALGLLGLILIGTALAQTGPSAATIGQIAGGLLLTAALYLILFWQLGGRIGHPWLQTVIFLSHRGILVPRRLRGRGVSQPPLSAALHGLLPAQCHRPGRTPLHETINTNEGSGYARGALEAARSQCSMPAACQSRVNALAVRSPLSTRRWRRSWL